MNRLTCIFISLLLTQIITAQNVFISDQSNPNEPSIMMDPENPNYLVAGSNLNKYYLSHDTGRTWQTFTLTSPYGVWGDPSIAVDTAGDFYFFHLSNPSEGHWIDRIVCQKSRDQGFSWNEGSFTGLNGDKEQDKEWFAIDPKTNVIYLTWTEFDEYGSHAPEDSSRIRFSKSFDGGLTWTDAITISSKEGDCIDSDNTVEGAVPAVGPNGEVYVAWAGPDGIVFNKSLDGGDTWLPHETPVDPMPTGWDYHIPGIYRANGLPVTVCDLSNGPHHGTIYINWSDQRMGSENTEVWLSKSDDGGETWSEPVLVNDDASGKHQFFTWMAIDQTNGNLYFVFYDRRDHNDLQTEVYVALSSDGGNTFINRKISESPFLPDAGIFFGDYTNIVAHNGIVRPIWTRLHEGELSIWTSLLNEEGIVTSSKDNALQKEVSFEAYPNPATGVVFVSYKIKMNANVDLSIIDMNGNLVYKIIDNEQRGYGSFVEKIDPKKLGLKQGIYLLQLRVDDKVHTEKQIIVE